jgi:hypothetical protein
VPDDRGDVIAEPRPERVSRGGRQPACGPVELPDGDGLVADRLLRRADRLPLGGQRQGQHKQVHRRQRGADEADRHVVGFPHAIAQVPRDGGRDSRGGDRREQQQPRLPTHVSHQAPPGNSLY